jgi:hypothetical protein
MLAPSELTWADLPSLPGVKIAVIEGPLNEAVPIMFRLKFPANYKVAPHWHPGIEHVQQVTEFTRTHDVTAHLSAWLAMMESTEAAAALALTPASTKKFGASPTATNGAFKFTKPTPHSQVNGRIS